MSCKWALDIPHDAMNIVMHNNDQAENQQTELASDSRGHFKNMILWIFWIFGSFGSMGQEKAMSRHMVAREAHAELAQLSLKKANTQVGWHGGEGAKRGGETGTY